MVTLMAGVYYSLKLWLAPDQENRTVPHSENLPSLVVPPLLLCGILALLSRRPNTRLLRLAVGPVAALILFSRGYAVKWFPPNNIMPNVVISALFTSTDWVAPTAYS
jgi:hypothetical protein